MKFLVIVFLASCIHLHYHNCSAQSVVIDSLLQRINTTQSKKLAALFNSLSVEYYYENTALSSYYAELALAEAKANFQYKQAIDAYINLGDCFDLGGVFETAHRMYDQAYTLNIKYKLNYKTIEIGNKKGVTMCDIGECEAGIALMHSLLNIKTETQKKQYLRLYSNIGLLYAKLGVWDSALYFDHYALAYNRLHLLNEQSYILTNLGQVMQATASNDSAEIYFLQALTSSDIANDIYTKTEAKLSLAMLLSQRNEYEKAFVLVEQLKKEAQEQGYAYGIRSADSLLASWYLRSTNYQKAYFHLAAFKNTSDSLYTADAILSKRLLAFDQSPKHAVSTRNELNKNVEFYVLIFFVFCTIFLIIYIIRYKI